jgi:hypothetical protein
MPTRKQIQPGKQLPLKLTAAERKLLLDALIVTGMEYEQMLRRTPTDQPVMMSLDDLEDFGGYVAAESNHCSDKKKQKSLATIFGKIQGLLDAYTDEEPPKTVKLADARKAKVSSDQAVQIAEWAAQALAAAEQLGIKNKPLDHGWLAPAQREVLLLVPGVTKAIKSKLAKEKSSFTVAEVASMTMALAEDLPDGDAGKQVAVLLVAKHLMDQLQARISDTAKVKDNKKAKAKVARNTLLQFKITLLGIEPAIWRRIQVQDCTLDKLHEHIQTAMGWTNSHLHQFEIKGKRYGDPELLDDGFEDFECVDSTKTIVSENLPKTGKRTTFKYEYDFGDGWEHEVLFEGCPPLEKGKTYPLCLEGERACPPEDVGGVSGYEDFLVAIADPKHEEHKDFLRWCGGKFSPDEFDPVKATREMKQGLPDWRQL